jgi:hypothetical protein
MRPGDFHLRRDDRQLFGNFVKLSALGGGVSLTNVRRSASFVETPTYEAPKFWRIEALFALPGGLLTPFVPVTGGNFTLRVTIRRALDRDKQTTTDVYDLVSLTNGIQNFLPVKLVSAQQLGINAELIGTAGTTIAVQISVVEDTGERDAYGNATLTRVAQSTTSAVFLQPNGLRRQFFVQNWGSSPLYISFLQVTTTPGGSQPLWTVALPNQGDIYESFRDCWQGFVSGAWDDDDADGYAMVTEGA